MYDIICQYGAHLLCCFTDSPHLTMPSGLEIIKGIIKKYIKVMDALEAIEEWASDAENAVSGQRDHLELLDIYDVQKKEKLADLSAEWEDIPPDIISDPEVNKDEPIPEELMKEYTDDILNAIPTQKMAIALSSILQIIKCKELDLEELANQELELQKGQANNALHYMQITISHKLFLLHSSNARDNGWMEESDGYMLTDAMVY
ncbi:hypothetical protein EW146_g7744 [Bondarzewia mesenterica]|uniref:Uncharacterized protein n=1 Tax=Bondarzewia mesenterica TaxID=1095465 RepID=A0A4S4LJR5_9AGAM|nr:hypothetical protein EW146_g7744 [Bondarzewia mesenterica]